MPHSRYTELLERLAAMVPRPRTNMLIYHGAFAPRGYYHETKGTLASVAPCSGTTSLPEASGPPKAEAAASRTHPPPSAAPRDATATATGYTRPRHFAWADLLRRVFLFDILACGECGGRLRLVATIAEPTVIAKILNHLGLPCRAPVPEPARPPPWLPGFAEH